jgi:Flp pilus assembly protein TadG
MLHRLRNQLTTLRTGYNQREPGQIILLFAVFVIVLMVLAGSAYDYASIVVDDAQLQNTVDAASLAGANALSTNAWKGNGTPQAIASATAASYLASNGVSTNATITIAFPTSTPVPNQPTPVVAIPVDNIDMQVTRSHQTAFWPLIGIPQVTMSNGGNAHAARGLVDVMLSLDMTYSMELTGSLQTVRDAVVSFVHQMRPSSSDPSGPLIGIARFAGIKCDYSPSVDWRGNVSYQGDMDASTCSNDVNLLTPLTNDAAKLLVIADPTTAGAAATCPGDSGTAQPSSYGCALRHVAYHAPHSQWSCGVLGSCPGSTGTKIVNGFNILFNSATNNAWSSDGRILAPGAKPARKVMILMTDGQNDTFTSWNSSGDGGQNVTSFDSQMQTAADNLTAAGIEVYVVGYFCTNGSSYDASNNNQGIYNADPTRDTSMCRSKLAYQPTATSYPHPCPAATIPAAVSPIDQKLINLSSSTTTNGVASCDHYFPLSKGQSLPQLFQILAGQIARGQLTQ